MMRFHALFPLALVIPQGLAQIATQTDYTWRPVGVLSYRALAAMVYDPVRCETVVYGGGIGPQPIYGDTWTWNGTRVRWMESPRHPAGVVGAAAAFDPVRRRIVAFGGYDARKRTHGDTWEWDGREWTRIDTGATHPPARCCAAMATDPVRGRIVLFGGLSQITSVFGNPHIFDDTWEWDGARWTRVAAAGSPPSPRLAASMAFNPRTGRVTLFGGHNIRWYADDGETYEWDGTSWTMFDVVGPGKSHDSAMCTAPSSRGVWLYGGDVAGARPADLWEWDGASWTLLDNGAAPGQRLRASMALDERRDRVTLFGGEFDVRSEIWERSAQGPWIPAASYGVLPRDTNRIFFDPIHHRFFYPLPDRYRVNHLIVLDGTEWKDLGPWGQPDPGSELLAYHAALARWVVFGGYDSVLRQSASKTRLWDGAQWMEDTRQPHPVVQANPPLPTQSWGVMAYDGHRQQVVLLTAKGETWEYGVQGWRFVSTSSSPHVNPPYVGNSYAMTYDPSRRQVVAVGRVVQGAPRTWTYDGRDWTYAGLAPDIDQALALHYVPTLDACLLVSGFYTAPVLSAWDGTSWRRLHGAADTYGHLYGFGHIVAYDTERQRLLALGYTETDSRVYLADLDLHTLRLSRESPRGGETQAIAARLQAAAHGAWLLALSTRAGLGPPLRLVPGHGWQHLPLLVDPLFLASVAAGVGGRLDGLGEGTAVLPIPADPQLAGLPLHAAALGLGPGGELSCSQLRTWEIVR